MQKDFGLGGAVVLKLVENLWPNKHFYFLTIISPLTTYFAVYLSIIYLLLGQSNQIGLIIPHLLAKIKRGSSFEVCSNHNIALLK